MIFALFSVIDFTVSATQSTALLLQPLSFSYHSHR